VVGIVDKNSKKERIYHYLIHGYYAAQIKDFKDIKCSKGYVSQVIKELLQSGYIKLIDRYPRRFSKTSRVYGRMFSNCTPGVSNSEFEQPRIHLNVVKFELLKPPDLDIIDEEGIVVNRWNANNSSFVEVSRFVDIGKIVYRLCNDKTLVVLTPGFFHDPENFRHYRRILLEKTEKYAAWFCKKYHCRIGEMVICRDSDIANTETDPYLNEMVLKYGMVKLVDQDGHTVYWWDQSKGSPEFETNHEDLAEIRVFMPLIVKTLEDRVHTLSSEVAAQGMLIESLMAKLDVIQDLIAEVKQDISGEKVDNRNKDEYIDVT